MTTLKPSHVPALHSCEQSSSPDKLIIIDQDALDDFGHFLSYDVRLAEAAHAAGCSEVSVIGHAFFNPHDFPREIDRFEPWFTVHSWTIGNRPDAICAPEDRQRFDEDLNFMAPRIVRSDPTASFRIYSYCGSFEQAEGISEFLDDHPKVSASVNLFWIYKVDETSQRFLQRWKGLIQKADKNPRLQLTVMTERQSDDLYRVTDVRIPVAPHPSTTFSDAALADMLSRKPHVPSDPFRVLFPGGMRPEKGFGLTVDAIQQLSADESLEIYVRTLEVPNTPPQMKRMKAKIGGPKVYLYPHSMSDADFAGMLDHSDLIVCPYLASDFARRTSGLVIDALLLGRPVVVTSGTWLEEVVAKYGFGIVAEPTAASLVKAINEAKLNFARLSENAQKARNDYVRKDSWARLYKSIIDPASHYASKNVAAGTLVGRSAFGREADVDER